MSWLRPSAPSPSPLPSPEIICGLPSNGTTSTHTPSPGETAHPRLQATPVQPQMLGQHQQGPLGHGSTAHTQLPPEAPGLEGIHSLGVREQGPVTVLVHGTQGCLLLPAGHPSTHPVLTSAVGSEGKAALGVETASTTGGGATTAGFASVSSAESSPLLESLPSAPVGKPMSCNTCRRETQAPSEGGLNHAEPLPHPGS